MIVIRKVVSHLLQLFCRTIQLLFELGKQKESTAKQLQNDADVKNDILKTHEKLLVDIADEMKYVHD